MTTTKKPTTALPIEEDLVFLATAFRQVFPDRRDDELRGFVWRIYLAVCRAHGVDPELREEQVRTHPKPPAHLFTQARINAFLFTDPIGLVDLDGEETEALEHLLDAFRGRGPNKTSYRWSGQCR